jgi:hypothetical protein
MDQLREFVDTIGKKGTAQGNLRGLLHILIGRRVTLLDGSLVSQGMTWRAVAALLKKLRWDTETVRDLNLDPAALPPRDRQRFWYTAISQAGIDTPEASAAADALIEPLHALGYEVGQAPSAGGR